MVILHNVTMNVCVQAFFFWRGDILSFLLGTSLGVELPGQAEVLCVTIGGTARLFSFFFFFLRLWNFLNY